MANIISTVERHPNRNAIISKMMAGVPLKRIAAEYNLSQAALSRFKARTLQPLVLSPKSSQTVSVTPQTVAEVTQAKSDVRSMATAMSTASYIDRKMSRYGEVLAMALEKGDPSAWASVDRAETAALQLRADLLGEKAQAQAPNVQIAILIPRLPPDSDAGGDEGEVIDVSAQ